MAASSSPSDVDLDGIREVLREHPVRLAVLFGSTTTGETHPRSDLDIAVEFSDAVDDKPEAHLSLLVDIGSALGRDDVDLSVVSDLKPRVGLAAFRDGVLLVGTQEMKEEQRVRFERAVAELDESQPSLRDRFDSVIEKVDEVLAAES